MSNDKKKFQKLSDDSMEKAAGGELHVEQEKDNLWNAWGVFGGQKYHIYEDGQDGKKTFDVHGLSKEQAQGLIAERNYDLKGKDPFTGNK